MLNVSTLVGVMGFSVLERWLDSRRTAILAGAGVSAVLLAVLAAAPDPGLIVAVILLVAFGLSSAYVMLLHAHARSVLPAHLVGRGLTLQNLGFRYGGADHTFDQEGHGRSTLPSDPVGAIRADVRMQIVVVCLVRPDESRLPK